MDNGDILMSMIHERIHAIDMTDFDYLFEQSLPRMDAGTYPWPREGMTFDEKRAHVLGFLTHVVAGPTFFGFKGLLDGYLVSNHFGWTNGDQYHGTITLVGPDVNGSRSYVYRPDVKQNLTDFLGLAGLTAFYGYMPEKSPLRVTLPARHPGMEGTYEPTARADRPSYAGTEKFRMF